MKRLARHAAALAFLLALLPGCKATTGSSTALTGPDAVLLAPEYPNLHLESLAYLGLHSLVPDAVAIQTTDGLLRSYLTGQQQKFLIVDESTLRSRAMQQGVSGELARIVQLWKDKGSIDRSILKSLGDKLGIDGVVAGSLGTWREEQVDWTSEGSSFTEVGIDVQIYESNTGILAWKGEKMERRESVHYRHEKSGTGIYSESGGTAERTERGDKIAPAPPPAEDVAESVVKNLVAGLPDKPAGAPLP
ncbi:MAG: hypothetical protein ACE15D_00235 [Candidatus Eisenbacteria bacterium]|nr:hypothetical protein [Candidatus Eisenbacteria bacterium]